MRTSEGTSRPVGRRQSGRSWCRPALLLCLLLPTRVLASPDCPADFNNDGLVDFFDYLDFVEPWGREEPVADFNRDGVVDFFDYLDFIAAWDEGCDVPEIEMVSVSVPPTIYSGRAVTVGYTMRNNGPGNASVPVSANVCGSVRGVPAVPVGPFETVAGEIIVIAPPSQPDCGQGDPCTVRVCADFPDADADNNCRSTDVSIIEAYWDLRVEVINSPQRVCRGTSAAWQIRVTNTGTVNCPPGLRVLTGICQSRCGGGSCSLGHQQPLDAILPGPENAQIFTVSDYPVPCGATLGPQFVRAGMCAQGCVPDSCAAGNCDDAPITIDRCGC